LATYRRTNRRRNHNRLPELVLAVPREEREGIFKMLPKEKRKIRK
jgi:hypothetical protein